MIKQANKKPSTDKRMKSVWSSTYNVRKNKITVIKNRKWFWISRAKPWVIPAFSVPSSTPNHILSTNTRTCVCLSAESSFCFKGSIGVSTLWPFTMQTMYCLTWLIYFFKSSICLSIIKYLDTNKCFFCLKKDSTELSDWKLELFCHLKGCSSRGTIPGTITSNWPLLEVEKKIWTQKISPLKTHFLQLAT